jgi:hypothetical protein
MANEISKTIIFTVTKNGATARYANLSARQNMSGTESIQSTQLIGTSAETVGLGEISGAPGKVIIKNLDSTNFVEIGGDSGLTVFKLKIPAGDEQIFAPTSGTIYAKADTANVRIQVTAWEL